MEYYTLGNNITAFTTDRTAARSPEKIWEALHQQPSFRPVAEPLRRFTYPHQTHTDKVIALSEDFFCLPIEQQKALKEGVDAVISNVKDACIGISTADCIPVLVYDPEHHCAAAIHAGWRGTVARIVRKAVNMMHDTYGTAPENCHAAIGPGISLESFEIGWEVRQKFIDEGFNMDNVTIILPSNDGNGTKPHIDLKEINRQELLAIGVKAENIEVSPIDTYTDPRFFSARREQAPPAPDGTITKCGRILSGFVLQ